MHPLPTLPTTLNPCRLNLQDESIRLWSVRSGACAAVFAGDQGHISEVLYVDINQVGTRMASAGMDSSIRIWSLEKLGGTIEEAHSGGPSFKPARLQAGPSPPLGSSKCSE